MRSFGLAFLLLASSCSLSVPHPAPNCEPIHKIEVHELRVLVMEDVKQRASLPAAQRETLTSKEFRDFLKKNCVKGPDGVTPEFRILNVETPLPPRWQATVDKYPRKSLPWMYVTNGSKGLSIPLPDSDKVIEVVSPYAN